MNITEYTFDILKSPTVEKVNETDPES